MYRPTVWYYLQNLVLPFHVDCEGVGQKGIEPATVPPLSSMITNTSPSENQILVAARMLGEYFYPNRGRHSPDWILVPAIRELAKLEPDASPQDLLDRFVAQSNGKYRKYLSRYVAALSTGQFASPAPDAPDTCAVSVFTGGRRFSFAKLSAMVSFFANRENAICREKLQYLLFYTDFTSYYFYDHSVSGAKYTRQRNSAVMHGYGSILKALLYTGVIRFDDRVSDGRISCVDPPKLEDVSLLELVAMHRVYVDFGPMTSREIREYSQEEAVFRFTRPDGYISYEYAQLLTTLPD